MQLLFQEDLRQGVPIPWVQVSMRFSFELGTGQRISTGTKSRREGKLGKITDWGGLQKRVTRL